MNKKKVRLLLLLIVPWISFHEVFASSVGKSESALSIEIQPSPIRITKVKAPVFGKYIATSKVQKINSQSDIFIDVEDNREQKNSPWQLFYNLSMFERKDQTDKKIRTQISLGKGNFYQDGKLKKDNVTSLNATINDEHEKEILRVGKSSGKKYRYIISNQDIELIIPKNIEVGKYEALQTVTLVNAELPD
ncbi:hypothetical protein [Vagococcus hydrophili]|uniref:WxL domain-containing protein n=1 Tax=Vagococcus hydrophili TaxID=2714947 RepID=A0A6G8AQZ8_9ENTE|nr:hypothetical protein [Vagococcus hydrophili]QIL47353.1 hypothetical protein G7082_01815 [Vagococcus hydrophili]